MRNMGAGFLVNLEFSTIISILETTLHKPLIIDPERIEPAMLLEAETVQPIDSLN